jgi:predicted DNA-binding protein (UPF0251 family)
VNLTPSPKDRPNGSPSERRSLILALARGWLLMGRPTHPVDPRRRVGAHRRLKDILLGTAETRASRDPWARFSGAMDRQALEEALATLREDELELVGLAYFEGRTNRAIAERLGLSVPTVRRRLRAAIQTMSEFLRDRGAGTWSLVWAPSALAGHRWRQWMDTRHAEPVQETVRGLAQVAVGALVVVTVVGAGAQVASTQSKPPPAAQAPSAHPTASVAVAAATPTAPAAAAAPSPAPSSTPAAPKQARVASPVTLVGGSTAAAATTTAQHTVSVAVGTVSTVTAVKLPSPPPLP